MTMIIRLPYGRIYIMRSMMIRGSVVAAAVDDNDDPAMLPVLYHILHTVFRYCFRIYILFPGWLVARSVRYYRLLFVVSVYVNVNVNVNVTVSVLCLCFYFYCCYYYCIIVSTTANNSSGTSSFSFIYPCHRYRNSCWSCCIYCCC